MSLMTIFVAVLCNTILGLFLLPQLAMANHGRVLFRGWYWFNQKKVAMYCWVPLAIGLLAWDYFIWKEARPKVKGWFTRRLLTFSLAAGVAPLCPGGGFPRAVTILLCIDPQSRDYLLAGEL
jgi:hypothetical protein